MTLHLTPDGERHADETIDTVASVLTELVGDELGAKQIASLNDGLTALVNRLFATSDCPRPSALPGCIDSVSRQAGLRRAQASLSTPRTIAPSYAIEADVRH